GRTARWEAVGGSRGGRGPGRGPEEDPPMSNPERKPYFTATEAAKLVRVAPQTVRRWLDSGRLRGDRAPDSAERRILREDLIQFMKQHGIPLRTAARRPVHWDGGRGSGGR